MKYFYRPIDLKIVSYIVGDLLRTKDKKELSDGESNPNLIQHKPIHNKNGTSVSVKFTNSPLVPNPDSLAKNVVAQVLFVSEKGNEFLVDHGLWLHERRDRTDFLVGDTKELIIAHKREDGACFVPDHTKIFPNEDPIVGKSVSLVGDRLEVNVTLIGENLKSIHTFVLYNYQRRIELCLPGQEPQFKPSTDPLLTPRG